MAARSEGTSAGLFLGLISGTSADAIDAVVVRFEPSLEVIASSATPYPPELREQVLTLAHGNSDQALDLDRYGALDVRVGALFAEAAQRLLRDAGIAANQVRAIGSHGQTVRHRPRGESPFTLQIGDPNVIAERTGIDTVADFRRRDLAAGGQGAPLVPAFHAAIFRDAQESRAVLNLGGIANFTLLPAGGEVSGFDTGPANALLDWWGQRHTGQPRDQDGALARSGKSDERLLARLLDDPYFALPPPKSTGREHFDPRWLQQRLSARGEIGVADVQATLVELSARSIAAALVCTLPDAARVIACGGGVHNTYLMQRLQHALGACRLESAASHGVDPDYVEAMAFAWLARETLARRPGNVPAVTGARGWRVLGALYPA